jgi:hypothetical protein
LPYIFVSINSVKKYKKNLDEFRSPSGAPWLGCAAGTLLTKLKLLIKISLLSPPPAGSHRHLTNFGDFDRKMRRRNTLLAEYIHS